MKLTLHDISTSLWQKLYDHYMPLLAKTRARAENIEISNEERMKLLYQIKFIKEFLVLSELDNKKTTRED